MSDIGRREFIGIYVRAAAAASVLPISAELGWKHCVGGRHAVPRGESGREMASRTRTVHHGCVFVYDVSNNFRSEVTWTEDGRRITTVYDNKTGAMVRRVMDRPLKRGGLTDEELASPTSREIA